MSWAETLRCTRLLSGSVKRAPFYMESHFLQVKKLHIVDYAPNKSCQGFHHAGNLLTSQEEKQGKDLYGAGVGDSILEASTAVGFLCTNLGCCALHPVTPKLRRIPCCNLMSDSYTCVSARITLACVEVLFSFRQEVCLLLGGTECGMEADYTWIRKGKVSGIV